MESGISKATWVMLVMLALCGTLAAIAFVNGVHASTSYTCLQCRAEFRKEEWLGVPSSGVIENDCSRWYAKVYPDHEHEWCWCGGERTRYPQGTMYSCGKRHPIWGMPPGVQWEFMRSAKADDLEEFWRTMKTQSHESQEAAVSAIFQRVLDSM